MNSAVPPPVSCLISPFSAADSERLQLKDKKDGVYVMSQHGLILSLLRRQVKEVRDDTENEINKPEYFPKILDENRAAANMVAQEPHRTLTMKGSSKHGADWNHRDEDMAENSISNSFSTQTPPGDPY